MNNLFCPKGKIDRCTFIINYLMLLAVYIILGIGLFLLCEKFHKMLTLTFIVLFFIKIFMQYVFIVKWKFLVFGSLVMTCDVLLKQTRDV